MAVRQNHYGGQKTDAFRRRRHKAERGHLLQGNTSILGKELSRFRIGIGAIHFRRHDNVIAHSEMFITEHFRLLSDSL